ncbi:MYG1 exonuclease [Poecile atricapillus]|uniref:MYG1 exonuclease n=1 Tax=Poecile atricapillus TaxID=48891 RepID=UPI002738CB5F|nr:MYG1 exonuclease [Poecile atricapillus]
MGGVYADEGGASEGRGLPAAMRGAARAARAVVMAATGAVTGTGHKRPHPEPAARIGTHDGTFHCDEALACFLLRLLPRYRDAEIVRTRDPQRLAACDVVVDVGGEYDPGRHRYDHHQRSFTESMRSLRPDKPWSTKLSSAGLVYCHFGSQILAGLLGQPEDGPVVTALYDKLYENFVEEVDAMDNGIAPAAGEPRYALSTTLSARVGHLNPRWNDPDQDTEAGFRRAMELAGSEFLQRLDFYHRAWLPARALVEEAVRHRFEVDASGQVLELSQGGCPWKEHLFQLERELALPKPLQLVLFPDRGGQWRVQSVPTAPHSFQSRLPLPEAWRGLRDEALSELAGIHGCIFVHASGFIGGNQTREGALEMARRALELGGGTEST